MTAFDHSYLRLMVAGIALALAAGLLGCGSDLSNPRDVYLEMRKQWERENYEEFVELLHTSARETLARADAGGAAADGLRNLLPPRSEVMSMVDGVLDANPEALQGLADEKKRQRFYRIQAARDVVRRKQSAQRDANEQALAAVDLRYVLAFTIPEGELGRRINPERDSVSFNLGAAGELTFPIQRDTRNQVRYMWPRTSR